MIKHDMLRCWICDRLLPPTEFAEAVTSPYRGGRSHTCDACVEASAKFPMGTHPSIIRKEVLG